MLKLLLIFGLTAYILYKVGSFLFNLGAASQQLRNNQTGNMPGNGQGKAPGKGNKKQDVGGEYIDYEEVK